MRAIIAAVADLLRVGRVPIARGRVIVNLDTTPVQLHTTTFQTGDPTGARNFSYLDRIRFIRLFTVGRATLSLPLDQARTWPSKPQVGYKRAAGRVEGVRPGCAVAVRLDAGHSRETFAVAVESDGWQDPVEVRRIEHQVAHEVVAEVDVRPRNVVVLGPGTIPKTPSGKLRRSTSVSLVT